MMSLTSTGRSKKFFGGLETVFSDGGFLRRPGHCGEAVSSSSTSSTKLPFSARVDSESDHADKAMSLYTLSCSAMVDSRPTDVMLTLEMLAIFDAEGLLNWDWEVGVWTWVVKGSDVL